MSDNDQPFSEVVWNEDEDDTKADDWVTEASPKAKYAHDLKPPSAAVTIGKWSTYQFMISV